ncbi:uncharacterized protein JN550_006971 [Neoarthrinium moseri]|uniref:uncharacterized protein n=1 Tax=Neoarthrinium moseri TaxID=1658444 RepID=UPI001FDDBD4F|nr:uncharacterized protein JN550_006971 [Neoarthrinium moseri]KAI1867830.1 hypothetical protein JN550_006971 [Neoarthrinium moseri]
MVTPAIAIIDRSVVEKLVYREPFLRSMKANTKFAFMRPKQFIFCRPFGIMWTLYAATYTVASCSDTLAQYSAQAAAATITFLSTTAVNVPLGIWKDIRFAQIYSSKLKALESGGQQTKTKPSAVGATKPTVPVPVRRGLPKAATALFLARDSITIFGSFTLAPRMASFVPDQLVSGQHAKATISQLTVPALTQLVVTPVHLLGLDLYHREQQDLSWRDRVKHTQNGLASTTVVRCLRILPAFGFGVIANTELRSLFHGTV